jgi:hypothetical protein
MQGSEYAKWVSWAVSLPILFSLAVCQSSLLSSSFDYANKKAEADGSPFDGSPRPCPVARCWFGYSQICRVAPAVLIRSSSKMLSHKSAKLSHLG